MNRRKRKDAERYLRGVFGKVPSSYTATTVITDPAEVAAFTAWMDAVSRSIGAEIMRRKARAWFRGPARTALEEAHEADDARERNPIEDALEAGR